MNRQRIEKIIEHLENLNPDGSKENPNFTLTVFISNANEVRNCSHTCGTVACALGRLPIVFPNEWQYPNKSENRYVELINTPENLDYENTWDQVQRFLEIPMSHLTKLFSPSWYLQENWENPLAVAKRLRNYLNDPELLYEQTISN